MRRDVGSTVGDVQSSCEGAAVGERSSPTGPARVTRPEAWGRPRAAAGVAELLVARPPHVDVAEAVRVDPTLVRGLARIQPIVGAPHDDRSESSLRLILGAPVAQGAAVLAAGFDAGGRCVPTRERAVVERRRPHRENIGLNDAPHAAGLAAGVAVGAVGKDAGVLRAADGPSQLCLVQHHNVRVHPHDPVVPTEPAAAQGDVHGILGAALVAWVECREEDCGVPIRESFHDALPAEARCRHRGRRAASIHQNVGGAEQRRVREHRGPAREASSVVVAQVRRDVHEEARRGGGGESAEQRSDEHAHHHRALSQSERSGR
mmetsp:Transcript_36708/g.122905  ORF Transcript_36708/g.122905 Transcript_36708/m.122905 type:complete len:319 (+) Transcript_36708:1519-2475(+)